jgi:hypothetical protein
MTEKEIIKGNKIIAEFMGGNMIKDIFNCHESTKTHNERCLHGLNISQSKYHSSWDWLMPVVEKMENIEHDMFTVQILFLNGINVGIHVRTKHGGEELYYTGGRFKNTKVKIEALWLCVVDFIKWYNKNK